MTKKKLDERNRRNRNQKCWNGGKDKNGTKNLGKRAERFWRGKFWESRTDRFPDSQVTDTLPYKYHLYDLVR